MKTLRFIFIGIALILTVIAFLYVDYSDFFSKSNRGTLVSATAMILMIVSLLLSSYEEKKKHQK